MNVPVLLATVRGPAHVYDFANRRYRELCGALDPIGLPFDACPIWGEVIRSSLHEVVRGRRTIEVKRVEVARAACPSRCDDGEGPGPSSTVVSTEGCFFDVMLEPLFDAHGEVQGVTLFGADVTAAVLGQRRIDAQREDLLRQQRSLEQERQATHAKLLHAQKLESLGVLAGGIAHDFNNLLTAIMGHASLALTALNGGTLAHRAVTDLTAAAHRAADLTRQLLAYSGKGSFSIRPIDLSTHVTEIAHLLETTVPKKVSLVLDLPSGLPAIEADVAQVQQVVMNLVMNGAEAIGDGTGTLRVRTGAERVDPGALAETLGGPPPRAGCHVFVEVKDDGCGMDSATRARMFDPFFTTKYTGRGLGLAAVSGIVRAHRGAIAIESAPGQGTTFRVYFPASTRPAEGRARRSIASFRGTGTVLLADDEAPVRAVTKRILEYFGFDVLEAANGREALEIFDAKQDGIALVLLDLTMPELGGTETLRALRARKPGVKVLLTSGYSEGDTRMRLSADLPDGFLEKPFTTGELAERLSTILGEASEDGNGDGSPP
jgi:signal transduction histidine kinase/ActR/RegA family two-component response regulator